MTCEGSPPSSLAPETAPGEEARDNRFVSRAWRRRGLLGKNLPAALLCACLFLLFATLGILSPGTFDDDDLGRYFYTRAVFESWDYVLSLFVRPAFALLYALPAQLGYGAVEIVTALLSAFACYFVYRTARLLDEEPAELSTVLTGLQPQFLAVSFSALCEPLAALLIASSLYLLEAKRSRASAMVVGVLPLARVELAPLLALWAIRFGRTRSWSAIVILPWAILLWNAAGFFHTGDPLFLLHQIFVDEARTYEATRLTHYLEGYIHVVGPAVFGLSFVGLVQAIRRRNMMIPVVGTIAVIGIYTLLSSVSSAGQSAGRLRYLVSIAPFFALLALQGFRACFVLSSSWLPVLVLAVATALCGLFLSREFVGGVSLGGEPDHANFYLLLLLLGAAVWRRLRSEPLIGRSGRLLWVALAVAILLAGTFRHDPVIALTPERRIMRAAAEWYLEKGLGDRVTLCNHVWFSALAGIDVLDSERRYLTKADLVNVPAGSIALWEPHYGDRHQGDVSLADVEDLSGYRVLRRFADPNTEFFAVALEKLESPRGKLSESTYLHEQLGIEWTGLASGSGWRWEPRAVGMTVLRGEHPRGAVLQLMRVRFVRFPSGDAYLSHIEADMSSQKIVSSIETLPNGLILWGGTRERGLVVVSIVEPECHEGVRLVGYFPPEDLQWMRREVASLLPGLRLLTRQ